MAHNCPSGKIDHLAGQKRPDKPHACTYEQSLITHEKSPHHHLPLKQRDTFDIVDNCLELIGNTPMVHLKNISADYGIQCNLYAKCEFMNAAGSVKDRIGLRMIEEAEREGRIKPGDTIIEPTSGNTGIGLAFTCAIKGYKCIIVMPEKMSKEKNDVLKALGAEIIRTPTSAAYDDYDSNICTAARIKDKINKENPNTAHILDQYTNPYNPIAHYDSTATEIIEQLSKQNKTLDIIFSSAGTGGTICGLARKLKEKYPTCCVVGVDPYGSILAEPQEINKLGPNDTGFYEVEGIGYDFIPTVLDRKRIDRWFKTRDKESLNMSRELLRREGLLCGGSCGAAVYAAIQLIKSEPEKYNKPGVNCVVILPDSIRNYMTKFLSDEWMITRGFYDAQVTEKDPWWYHLLIKDTLSLKSIDNYIIEYDDQTSVPTIRESIDIMKQKSIDLLLIINKQDNLLSKVITKKSIMSKLVNNLASANNLVTTAALDKFRVLFSNDKLRKLQCCLDSEGYAIILDGSSNGTTSTKTIKRDQLYGVVSADVLLDYISSK